MKTERNYIIEVGSNSTHISPMSIDVQIIDKHTHNRLKRIQRNMFFSYVEQVLNSMHSKSFDSYGYVVDVIVANNANEQSTVLHTLKYQTSEPRQSVTPGGYYQVINPDTTEQQLHGWVDSNGDRHKCIQLCAEYTKLFINPARNTVCIPTSISNSNIVTSVMQLIYAISKIQDIDIESIIIRYNGIKLWHDASDPECEISI